MTVINRLQPMKSWTVLLVITLVVVFSLPPTALAESSDTSLSLAYEDEMTVSDFGAVWTSFDNDNHRQVYYSAKPGEAPQTITHSVGIRQKPVLGGSIVVWQENPRESRGPGGYNLYAYNLETKETRSLTENNQFNENVTTDGRYIAWIEGETRIVNLYDWQTKQVIQLGKGNNPIVAKGKMAFENNDRNQILQYNPSDHSTKTLVSVSKSYYLSGFKFNGDWLLYLKMTPATGYILSLLKADGNSEPSFESGTESANALGSMTYSSLNENYAIFQMVSSGQSSAIAIDLSSGQAKPLNIPGQRETIVGLQGDTLFYSLDNYWVQSLTISKTLTNPGNTAPLLPKEPNNSNVNQGTVPTKRPNPDQLIVSLDDKEIAFEVNPVVENGSSMVQFRPLFEAMGISIEWREEDQTIIGSKGKFRMELMLGNATALVNGKQLELPVAPHTINGSTMVPLRFVAESTGRSVYWVPSFTEKEVRINRTVGSDILDDLYADNLVYQGETLDGVPHGKGKFTKDGKLRLEGQFVNGVMEGSGSVYRNGKLLYTGDLKDNVPHGQGKLYDLGLYVGSFENGLRHGQGKYYETNGELIYSGQFTTDTETGKGTLYESNGTRYVGDVIMGIREGNAEVYDQDGDLQFKGRYAGNHPALSSIQLTYLAMYLYAEAGKDVKATAMFEKARKTDSQVMVPYYMAIEAYLSLSNTDRSSSYIQAGSSVNANDPILYAYQALTYALLSKPEQAKTAMDKAKLLGLKSSEKWEERLKGILG